MGFSETSHGVLLGALGLEGNPLHRRTQNGWEGFNFRRLPVT